MTAFELVIAVITLLAIALVVYHHVGHPLVQMVLLRVLPAPWRPSDEAIDQQEDTALPRIALVMPAYNEAEHIVRKMEVLRAVSYPRDRLQIVLVCDGCKDDTAALARTCLDDDGRLGGIAVEIQDHADNKGKLARLNETLPQLDEFDLVALSDISALLSSDCLEIAAAWFENPTVGGVMGRYELIDAGGDGQAAYWTYQVKVKEQEDRMGCVLGAHGAFYVMRQALFQPLPDDTINDDFILPMNIVSQGFAMRYDSRIVAFEKETVADRDELARRKRIAVGNVQQAIRLRHLIKPRYGLVAYNFLFGKVLRAFCPLLLVLAFAGSIILAPSSLIFALALLGQMWGYGLVLWHHLMPNWPGGRVLSLLHYVVAGHAAGLAGLWTYMTRGTRAVRWNTA